MKKKLASKAFFTLEALEDIMAMQVIASGNVYKGATLCWVATINDVGFYIGIARRNIKKGTKLKYNPTSNTKDILTRVWKE